MRERGSEGERESVRKGRRQYLIPNPQRRAHKRFRLVFSIPPKLLLYDLLDGMYLSSVPPARALKMRRNLNLAAF